MEQDERLVAWRNEQYLVASQVLVRKDAPPPTWQWRVPKKKEKDGHDDDDHDDDKRSTVTDEDEKDDEFGYSWYCDDNDENDNDNGNDKDDDKKSKEEKTELYGGVDVSFPENDKDPAVAVYVVVQVTRRNNNEKKDAETTTNFQVVYCQHKAFELEIPYISSYLSFREIGPLQSLVQEQVAHRPELTPRALLVDGNGILHERRAGIACFLGVRTGIPTIGVGKSLYCHDGLYHTLVETAVEAEMQSLAARLLSRLAPKKKEKEEEEEEEDHKTKTTTRQEEECFGGIIVNHAVIQANDNDSSTDTQEGSPLQKKKGPVDMSAVMTILAQHCDGFAIPMVGASGTVWGAALVGHGGKIPGRPQSGGRGRGRGNVKRKSGEGPDSKEPATRPSPPPPPPPAVGTKNPIYISVGHDISLVEALQISAKLSRSRIPEPVRQADLIGRGLLRDLSRQSQTTMQTLSTQKNPNALMPGGVL